MRRSMMALGASMTLAALAGTFALAQEPKGGKKEEAKPAAPAPPPAPPTPQEKAQFPTSLDSWYKVFHEGAAVGHVSEIFRPGSSPARYDYRLLVEYELPVEDPSDASRKIPSLELFKVDAKLDDSFAPFDMTCSLTHNNVETVGTVLQVVSGGVTGRRLGIKVAEAQKSFPVPSGVDIFYSPRLMFAFMRQNDQLSRTGLHSAKVFYPRANEVPVVDVSFDVKGWVQREYMGKKISVTRIEWIKPMPASSREMEVVETYVDKYGRVVEEITRDNILRFLIVKGEEEAVGQSTRLRSHGRSDPFRKDLAMVKVVVTREGGKGGVGPPPVTLDDGLAQAEKIIEELKKAKERNDLAGARKEYDKGIGLLPVLWELAGKGESNPEVRGRLDDIKRKLEGLLPGAKLRLAEARVLYARALEQFDREDVPGMEKTVNALRDMEKLPEFFKAEEELRQVKTWGQDLVPLLARCKMRLELAKKKLTLTGVTLCFDEKPQVLEPPLVVFGHVVGAPHDLRFIRATHFAIINDKMYKVGDMVEGEGVKVEVIRKYSVQVSLQEETREVGIRQ